MLNSLSQNLTVLPAPSGREPLAKPHTLHFNRKLYRYAKGPILEDDFPRPGEDVTEGDKKGNLSSAARLGEFRNEPLPSSPASSHLPQGDGFSGGGKLCGSAERRPLGGAVAQRLKGFFYRKNDKKMPYFNAAM